MGSTVFQEVPQANQVDVPGSCGPCFSDEEVVNVFGFDFFYLGVAPCCFRVAEDVLGCGYGGSGKTPRLEKGEVVLTDMLNGGH